MIPSSTVHGNSREKPKQKVLAKLRPKKWRPYLFIAFVGVVAFAPVSFMLRSLKNDLVALEYPINYFISQSIHHGEIPLWFNTWGLGFPLQSNLTWGIFSTPQLLFCSIFNYDMHALHIEFVFFVVLSGWSMYYLLKKHFLKDETITVLLSCCYMLSGFVAGSGQWMLYITGVALIPLVLHALLQLLKAPGFKNALLFAVLYYVMFTSVYAALNIITSYSILVFIICWMLSVPESRKNRGTWKFLLLTGLLTVLFCLPCLLSTVELLKWMERGNPISGNAEFFASNYLHPKAMTTLMYPFSSVKMSYPHTEGTMLDTYMGLFTLLLLPIAIARSRKEKNWVSFGVLFSALFFLLISFGNQSPLRQALNVLPGFSYFRNPALFRSYFILLMILYVALAFRNSSFQNIFSWRSSSSSGLLKTWLLVLSVSCIIVIITNFKAGRSISFSSLDYAIRNLTFSQSLFISALLQLLLLVILFILYRGEKLRLIKRVFALDLLANTLLVMPYFVVSSHSPAQVNSILHSEKGFPVQWGNINEVAATFTDERSNTWNNVNIFFKKVSPNESYRGPLVLRNFAKYEAESQAPAVFERPVAYIRSQDSSQHFSLVLQKPTHLRVVLSLTKADSLTVMQNYFPGWKAFYNNTPVDINKTIEPGMTIAVLSGEGVVDFRYQKQGIWVSALLLHIIVLTFIGWNLVRYLANRSNL